MKIVVTGGNGTMGQALREFLPDAVYLSRAELDVRNGSMTADVIARENPDVVIHAAALTNHQHPNAGEIIETNILGTEHVARVCRSLGIKLVYLSTHYVYPGETGNYRETDATRPIGTYAWSKLAGEGWAKLPEKWLIVRGSWYTPAKLRGWVDLGAFTDAFCNRETPQFAAMRIATLVARDAVGIFNIGGTRRSFYQIAYEEGFFPRPETRTEYKVPYPFPADSSVNTDKYNALVAS